MMGRRANGEGTITEDKKRARWIGIASFRADPVTGKRIRRKVSGRTKLEARARLAKLLEVYIKQLQPAAAAAAKVWDALDAQAEVAQ